MNGTVTQENTLYETYRQHGFKPLRCAGYHPQYNRETSEETRYKRAKEPVTPGFTSPEYDGLTPGECEQWETEGGVIGWLIPKSVFALDIDGDGWEDRAEQVKHICREKGLNPPIHKTNKGVHIFFKTGRKIPGSSHAYTKSGLKVTYRAGGSNQLILPPWNGRTWLAPFNGNLPELPPELEPYDSRNKEDALNVLAARLAEATRAGSLSAYDDLDAAFMGVLVEAGIEEGRILQVFRQIFGSAYDERKTLQMYRRAKAKIEGGEQLRGAGSFIHSLRESGLKDLEHLTHVVAGRIQVEEEWVEPIPFDSYDALPDFPIEALPQAGREMVEATADVNQVDPGLPASIYLACLSVALAKKACVNLASHSEPLNLYVAPILDSGERKSSTMRTMTDPVYEYQAAEQEGKEEEIRKAANAHKIRETRLDRLQKEAAKCDDFSERKRLELDAAEIAREIAENSVPNVPVFILDDVTTESLGIHMSENGERMAIMSTEGGVFSNMTGRYDKKTANFDLYLKAHAGDPLSITRVHRGANTMQSPALTMCLTVQPDVIKEIGQNKQFRGRGLTARFLYSVCKPQAGYRKRQDKAIPGAIIEGYHAHITELANISPGEHILKLSQDAQAFWDEFYNDIELEIRPGGSLENLPDWGSKLPGAVARIAGLLHFAEHEMKALELPVSVDTVKGACVIGAYFKDHALAAFDLMHSDPAIESGKRILKAIVRHSLKQLKPSDVFQYTNLRTLDEITPGLKVLLEREYIREMNQQYSGKGRPRAATYAVNPNIIKGGFQP